jgi:hypothetical protein
MTRMETWLAARLRTQRWTCLAGSALLLVLAAVALAVTFSVCYAILLVTLGGSVSEETRTWICAGILAVLIILNSLTNRNELEEFRSATGTTSRHVVSFYLPAVGRVSNVNPFAPDRARNYVRMFAGLLLIGPRLLGESWTCMHSARRVSAIDVEGCAPVLSALCREDRKVPFTDLVDAVQPGKIANAILQQMLEIQGVMLIRTKPPGLTLLGDLREELNEFRAKKAKRSRSADRSK